MKRVILEATVNSTDFKNKFLPNVTDEQFNDIMSIDPTSNLSNNKVGKFALVLANWVNKDPELASSIKYDRWDLKDSFDKLLRVKQAKKLPNDFDFKKFDSHYDFIDYIMNLDFQSNRNKDSEIKKQAKNIYDDGTHIVVSPTTKEASILYGKGTKWCTAGVRDNMFENYNSIAPLYIFIKKDSNKKYQIHFDPDKTYAELNDEENNPVTVNQLLEDFPQEALDKVLKLNPNSFIQTEYGYSYVNSQGDCDYEDGFENVLVKPSDYNNGIVVDDHGYVHLITDDDGISDSIPYLSKYSNIQIKDLQLVRELEDNYVAVIKRNFINGIDFLFIIEPDGIVSILDNDWSDFDVTHYEFIKNSEEIFSISDGSDNVNLFLERDLSFLGNFSTENIHDDFNSYDIYLYKNNHKENDYIALGPDLPIKGFHLNRYEIRDGEDGDKFIYAKTTKGKSVYIFEDGTYELPIEDDDDSMLESITKKNVEMFLLEYKLQRRIKI